MTTAPWLAGDCVSAYEVRSGNPTTTPLATTARRSHWPPLGPLCRVTAKAMAASAAATTARPEPMNSGDRPSCAATRVNGTVKENATTPSSPQPSPDGGRAGSWGSSGAV